MHIFTSYSRYIPLLAIIFASIFFYFWHPFIAFPFIILSLIGFIDLFQKKRAIIKNYPLTGRLRYLLEYFRPEIRQYFLESDEDKLPFSRNQRAMVYARSKIQNDKRGFGTIRDMYSENVEWLGHSILPTKLNSNDFRIDVGGKFCKQKYSASIFNISGMSFGALSPNAVMALNHGAKMGNFAQDTGEGSISKYHKKYNGDLIWQIGSGYFGCRDENGSFDPDKFKITANLDQVKMIEIKLSQGAKPGHGGVLPKEKISKEIAEARGINNDTDCISPNTHSAFSKPKELLSFINILRNLSNSKPVGFKLCIGHPWEWFAIAKAMESTKIFPDFIVIDGAEGGTGAAPVEFADNIGMPMREGLRLVHNTLVGLNIREEIKLGCAGRIISAFDIARCISLGADWCNSARGFMFSLGCIQSRSCHTDHCPTGVATQDSLRQTALNVKDKSFRVKNFHSNTLKILAEMISAAGLKSIKDINPDLIMSRESAMKVSTIATYLPTIKPGSLVNTKEIINAPPLFKKYWHQASEESFSRLI